MYYSLYIGHKGELVNVFCGTVSYMAPEVVAKLPY